MLAITAKARLLKGEVNSAINVCKCIIGSLQGLQPDSDYRKDIGIFAVQMPDWKILADERVKAVNLIRQVCTGEVPSSKAIDLFNSALNELEILNRWLQIPQK